ncbi:type II toxin-antitoxin system RelE/ParE family toxin [Leptospira ilyithenensis]|uniref:Type II toxin-antitoxin system RelE/ParE family toxin n=1 Tax=Leptospira ilyithenensis TaxID=2484901 RepID=A0A4R9LQ35_9LEPT|nr:type II toxin-antitoxin system RelE/ParE family toxin [Leptospira ilyithenensis]TGN11204.1 type II toxin-antitoxin system RelE/ParE family toxin [Leptospira ilyithenensis]
MIISFADSESEEIWKGTLSKRFPKDIQRTARRKMIQIDGATDINDLKIPPGNRLHSLSGDRSGQWSISINMKYRICFRFNNHNAFDLEIVDYH